MHRLVDILQFCWWNTIHHFFSRVHTNNVNTKVVHHYRKPDVCRVPKDLPSAQYRALGKITICRVPELCRVTATWHSAKPHFAECLNQDTRRTPLCRVPRGQHSANSVTCATHARTRPLQRGRHYSLPSASQCALGKDYHVRCTRALPRCHPVATNVTLQNFQSPLWFAECQAGDTRQNFLCRVLAVRHSAKLCECRVQ